MAMSCRLCTDGTLTECGECGQYLRMIGTGEKRVTGADQSNSDRSLLASSVQALTADIETYKALVQKMRPVFEAALDCHRREVRLNDARLHDAIDEAADKEER